MSGFTQVYLLAVFVLLLAEGIAIGRRSTKDTISGHIWAARASGLLVWPMMVLVVWGAWHLAAPWEPDDTLANDLAYVIMGVVVAYFNVVALEKRQAKKAPPQ